MTDHTKTIIDDSLPGVHSFDDYRVNGALKDAFTLCLSSLAAGTTQREKRPSTIALDLEGTLISHASSMIPRPGLYQFMQFCRENFTRMVFFSFVEQERGRQILQQMVDAATMPDWVIGAEYVTAIGGKPGAKDLRLLGDPEDALLVDDQPHVVPLDQRARLIQIAEFKAPLGDDNELAKVQQILAELLREGE